MSILRGVLAVLTGILLGVAVLFLALVSTGATAWFTDGPATIPGILRVWFSEENGTRAMNFKPHGIGMLTFILIIAALYFSASFLRRSARRNKPRTNE